MGYSFKNSHKLRAERCYDIAQRLYLSGIRSRSVPFANQRDRLGDAVQAEGDRCYALSGQPQGWVLR
jgi:hypothetical protein